MRPGRVVALALLVACRPAPEDLANGPDALKALAQHVESSRYGPDYWKQAAVVNTAVWRQAVAFCRNAEATQYPTCASVKMTEFLQGNTQPAARPAPFTFRNDSVPDSGRGR